MERGLSEPYRSKRPLGLKAPQRRDEKKPGLAARTVAVTILTRVLDDKRGLDGLLDSRHGPSSYQDLSSADKALVRAIANTAFRHRGEIDFVFSKLLDRPVPKKARHLQHTLHVAAAQILFLDVPDSAAVDLAVTALKSEKRSARFASLANAVLRRMAREKEDLLRGKTDEEKAVLNTPSWFHKRTRKAYGRDRAAAIAQHHMLEPVIDISVKGDPSNWLEKLNGVPLFGNSIRVTHPGKIETWPGYDEGNWWVQDAAASLPAILLGEIQGLNVADLCAAPGGKTAQLVYRGGNVTALEASADRLVRLQKNLDRLKLSAKCIEGDLFHWQPDQLFDAILLDAPCSSTGTIRRHPDVQWTKTPEVIDELARLQHDMILKAADFLKPEGRLVFANCSLDRAEGEDIYARIMSADIGLKPDPISADEIFGLDELLTGQGTVRTLPCHMQHVSPPEGSKICQPRFTGLDGFFAARFRKAKV